MAVAVIGQQQAAVAQPVDVDLDVSAVHNQDVRGRGLTRHLRTQGLEVRVHRPEVAGRSVDWLVSRGGKSHIANTRFNNAFSHDLQQ